MYSGDHPAVLAAIAALDPHGDNPIENWDEIIPHLESLPRVRWPEADIKRPIPRYVGICVEEQSDGGWNLLNAPTPTQIHEIGAEAIVACCRGYSIKYRVADEKWDDSVVQRLFIGRYRGYDDDGDMCAVIYLGDCSGCSGIFYYFFPYHG